MTLPAAGTYTLLVDPQGTDTGTVAVQLFAVPADAAGGVLTVAAPVSVSTTVPGQNASATFAGTAGKRVSVELTHPLTGSYPMLMSLLTPDGGQLTAAWVTGPSYRLENIAAAGERHPQGGAGPDRGPGRWPDAAGDVDVHRLARRSPQFLLRREHIERAVVNVSVAPIGGPLRKAHAAHPGLTLARGLFEVTGLAARQNLLLPAGRPG